MNTRRHQCYIATVCLDRNRWGTREPSFAVSDYLDRFASDGFDGIELWEYHYTRSSDAEKERLVSASPISSDLDKALTDIVEAARVSAGG